VSPVAARAGRRGRVLRGAAAAVLVLAGGLVLAPYLWTGLASHGRVYADPEDAPPAQVAIVFGAQLAPGGHRPMPFLAGRLDVAARLVREGRVRALLVSGDGHGGSGDEVAVMRGYLVAQGVDPRRVVTDPYGLDSYDTCRRARDVYGVRRALLVSQSFHLPRAVTLCRSLGIDADGVAARCDDCRQVTIAYNSARELAAGAKAVLDAWRGRPPAVRSDPDPALRQAAAGG
jgi:vancomycin permeability regulator SanA